MKHFLVIIALLLCGHVAACETAMTIDAVKELAYSDKDMVSGVCGDPGCSSEEFANSTDVTATKVGQKGDRCVYVVEPVRKARNMFISVISSKSEKMHLNFVFFGSGVKVVKGSGKDFPDLMGREIGDEGKILTYRWRWDGAVYKEISAGARTPCVDRRG